MRTEYEIKSELEVLYIQIEKTSYGILKDLIRKRIETLEWVLGE